MKRALIGAAIAVALFSSVAAFGGNGTDAVAPPPPPEPSMPAETTHIEPMPVPPPTPVPAVAAPVNDVSGLSTLPPSLKCKAPKVPRHVKNKAGKLVWRCVKPVANTTSHKSPGRTE